MAHVSNHLLGMVNLVILVLSVPAIVLSVYLWQASATQCGRNLQLPLVVLSIIVLVLAVAGLLAVCCRLTWLMWLYLGGLAVMISGFLCATALVVAVLRNADGVETVPGKAYKEFRAEGYSEWMRQKVDRDWGEIKRCLIQGNVCGSMAEGLIMSAQKFSANTLTPIQSGCCKPPNDCNFQYVNPTKWMQTNQSLSMADHNCRAWSNDANIWCFNCEACKAAVVFQFNFCLMKLVAVNIVCLFFCCVIFAIGCCALRNTGKMH